jgi:hypothetical protein
MTDDLIFRMTMDQEGEAYKIEESSHVPDNIKDLEEYFSNTIMTRERKEDESNLP